MDENEQKGEFDDLSDGRVKKLIEELEAFTKTSLYSCYKATLEMDINAIIQTILLRPPVNPAEVSDILMLHGRKEAFTEQLTIFESLLERLKAELLHREEAETERKLNQEPT